MNEIESEKKSEFEIVKNRIENIKKRKNALKKKNFPLTPHRAKRLLLLKRPKSNYIPNSNKILELRKNDSKIDNSQIRQSSRILENKLISASEINENSLSLINFKTRQKHFKNKIFYENYKESIRSERNFDKTLSKVYKIPRSAKNQLKISKSFLNEYTIFNQMNNNTSQRMMRGSLSPRNDMHKNKYLEITRELLSGKKNSILIPNSPSTTNNSNINNDNSYSSHFLFGVSSLNSNIYPRVIQNNFISENKINKKDNKNKKNCKENSIIMKSIEYDINKLLLRSENTNKKNKLVKETHNSCLDEFFSCYANNFKEKSKTIYVPIKTSKRNKTNSDENILNNSINLIRSLKNIKETTENNKNNNSKKVNTNKTPNLIIKYAFLNNEMFGIKRKVDFVNPKSGEQIKFDTANIDKNNKLNIKREDFKTYGYEMTPEYIYKLHQNDIQKSKIIKLRGEKTNKKFDEFSKESDEKKIQPRYYISNQNNVNLSQNQRFRKEESKITNKIKKRNLEEIYNKTKDKGNDTDDLLSIYNFGLGESLYKNRLDYNSIRKEDREAGKLLWTKLNKLNKSEINIHSNNIKSKINEKISNIDLNKVKARVKSAKLVSNKFNKKEKQKKEMQNNQEKKNNNKTFVRSSKRRTFTQQIDSLKQHKLFRNEKGFNEIQKMNNNFYNIEFKITDDNEDEECTIVELFEEKKKKEMEELQKKEKENMNENKNISRRRNTTANLGQFVNKLFKIKKNPKKDLYRTNNKKGKYNQITERKNKDKEKNKEIKVINKSQKQNIFNEKIDQYKREQNKKFFEKFKHKNQKKEKLKIIKEINEEKIIFSKNKSFELKKNQIFDEFSLNSKNEKKNYSEENIFCPKNIKVDKVIRRQEKRKSTLLFDRLFKNLKFNYKESENMTKYFDEIFNKYAKEDNDEQLVDIKFCGLDFKIKRKNQKNFKNILMTNIRQREENRKINLKLDLILDKYKKNKLKKNNLYESSILFGNKNKNSKTIINEISKEIDKNELKTKNNEKPSKRTIKENEKKNEEDNENELKSKYFKGINMDSTRELKQKKEEILEKLKDEIELKIKKGDIGRSEMNNFLDFKKRMIAYDIDTIQNGGFVKLLEQEFISFEEELRVKEQKKKEEKRINNFIDNMNDDFERNHHLKIFQKKFFCNVIDFNKKYNINTLSPTKKNK